MGDARLADLTVSLNPNADLNVKFKGRFHVLRRQIVNKTVERLLFGDILFVVTLIAERLGIDAEQALRRANAKFRTRFGQLEALARAGGADLRTISAEERLALWEEAKRG